MSYGHLGVQGCQVSSCSLTRAFSVPDPEPGQAHIAVRSCFTYFHKFGFDLELRLLSLIKDVPQEQGGQGWLQLAFSFCPSSGQVAGDTAGLCSRGFIPERKARIAIS